MLCYTRILLLYSERNFIQVEAFLWTIGQVNARFSELGYNFSFGAWIKNSCDNGVIGLQQSLAFVRGHLESDMDGICHSLHISRNSDKVIYGLTGAVTSAVSKRVAPVLEVFCLPLISPYATSPELSNNNIYPYFLRTVPEDVYQSWAIFWLLKNRAWTQIAIVYEHTTYGDHFDKELLEHIESDESSDNKVCVENNIGIIVEKPVWSETFNKLWNGRSRVVVLILDFSIARQFFTEIKTRFNSIHGSDFHMFQWIGTDGWSRTTTIISEAKEIAENCITAEPYSLYVPDFSEHLNNLSVSNIKSSENQKLLTLVLQNQHNCCMNATDQTNCPSPSLCHQDLKIIPSDAAAGRAHFVIEGVKIFGEVFEQLLNETCSNLGGKCDFNFRINGSQLFTRLRNVSIPIVPGRIFQFFGNNSNNGPPVYSYFQLQRKKDGTFKWQSLGEISFENQDHVDLRFNESAMLDPFPVQKIAEAKHICTPICKVNYRRFHVPEQCCWGCEPCGTSDIVNKTSDSIEVCQPCNDMYSPDINHTTCVPEEPLFPKLLEMPFTILITLSLVGLGFTVTAGAIFYKGCKTPLVQLRVPIMVAMLLSTNAIIFISPMLLFLQPSKVTCTLHWTFVGMAYTASIATLAAMAQRLVNFSGLKFLDVKLFDINWKTMIIQVVFICLIEIGLIVLWILVQLGSPAVLSKRDVNSGHTFVVCNDLNVKVSLMLFVVPLLLVVIIPGYLLVKSRPKTVYATLESRQIILACTVVLCLFLLSSPIAGFVGELRTKVTLHLAAVIAGAYGLLLTMHAPNVFFMLMKAKMNTMKYLAVGSVTYRNWRRLKKEDISYEKWLGEGHYGEAWKAKLQLPIHEIGHRITAHDVVVKVLKEGSSDQKKTEFREEALLMSRLEHKNILQLVGICMTEKPMLLVIEFMNGGSLEKYLRKPEVQLPQVCDSCDLHHILMDVVKACQYLEHEGYIHRDIAARNCLVELVGEQVLKPKCTKLGDFGMAKDVRSESNPEINDGEDLSLPVAWTAPEGFDGSFSNKSDVWSFGVLMWEVFTWGSIPFGKCFYNRQNCDAMELSHAEIKYAVCIRGERVSDHQDSCHSQLFPFTLKQIMEKCWQFSPAQRPSFKQIQVLLNRARNEILTVNRQACARVQCQSCGGGQMEERAEFIQSEQGNQNTHTTLAPAYSKSYNCPEVLTEYV